MSKNDGGPAFPGEYAITMRHPEGGDETRMVSGAGMSLRDYFAGQAVIGLMTMISAEALSDEHHKDGRRHSRLLAAGAYEIADAMLAEREKRDD